MEEPAVKRAFVFVDGQNFSLSAKSAFGCRYPDYDICALAAAVCAPRDWLLDRIHFYTGIHGAKENPFWHGFWVNKLRDMKQRGVATFSRPLRYREKIVRLGDGVTFTAPKTPQEKGVDVRIALDIVKAAHGRRCDVVVIFSQDQDLAEAAMEAIAIAREQNRWIKIASAYPRSPQAGNRRGVNRTDWIPIERELYESCLDPKDYRPRPAQSPPLFGGA